MVHNLGQILHKKNDLDGALTYTKQALKMAEETYGPDHPFVGVVASNVGTILKDKGDLEGTLPYVERALKIHEKVTDYPSVARDASIIVPWATTMVIATNPAGSPSLLATTASP